ncbi:Efflux transporter, RND family, MFP subunit [candidate division SR1 bacterium RAAC1_SR1_1]|nr:Efflux transporter, RND family, MFP subunit [candidate division SR1 bacterium RAAC1_SR1_1]
MDFKKEILHKAHKIWAFLEYHKWYSLIGLVLILGILIYSFSGSSTNEIKTQKTYIVTTGSIENSVKVLGDTKITNQQTLTFAYAGTIKALYVKEGDIVKKNQLLAEIDKGDLQKNIAQQSLSLQSTKISYQKVLNQYSEVDLLKAQQNINDSLLKLSIAKKDLQDMTTNQGDSLQTSDMWIQSLLISSKTMVIDIKGMLDSVDKIFWFSGIGSYAYDNISYCISENDPLEKGRAETSYNLASSKLITIEKTIQNIENSSTTTSTILQNLQNANKDLLTDLSTMFDHALIAAKATPLCGGLNQSQIDSRVSTINNGNTKALSYISSSNNNINSIKSSEIDILNKQNEIKNYETQVAIYKETLQEMIEGLSYEDKILQENNIKQGEISLSKLVEQKENYEIRAPFDGSIDMVTFKVGDNISSNTISEEGITISNPNFYEIHMLIDQVDIVKIEKGQIANITFDAYPGYSVTGEISNIDPTPTTSAGVVSYTAIINMEKGEKKIYDSMTVNIEIITEQAKNVMIIPTTAIQTRGQRSVVQIIKNGNSTMKPIEIGIHDTFNTEVTSGLNLGETILLDEYKTVSGSSNSKSTGTNFPAQEGMSSMRGLGVGGGGGGFPRN